MRCTDQSEARALCVNSREVSPVLMFSPRNKGGFVTSWTLEIGLTTCLLYMSTCYPGQRISISVTIDSGSLLHYSRVVVIVVLFTLHLTHHTSRSHIRGHTGPGVTRSNSGEE